MRCPLLLLRVLLTLALCSFARGGAAQADALPPLRDRVTLGAYVPGLPYFERSAREFEALEKRLGSELPILSGFVDWNYVFGGARDLALAAGGKRTLLYSWEPHCGSGSTEDGAGGCISFAAVARGDHDAYLMKIVESMRKFPHTIYVRPWGEMNADWSAWQPGSGRPRAGTAEEFVAAWRHVRALFRREGIDNLKFIFNPDAADDETTVRIPTIWPGAEYVDVLGIDGYNWGNGMPGGWGTWQEFEAIFQPMYDILTALHPTAPVWICEFGSKEPLKRDGEKRPSPRDPKHDKGAWIANMMSSTKFPRLTALVHFNVFKERDFRFESSPTSLRAIRKQLRLRKGGRARAEGPLDKGRGAGPYSVRTSRSIGMPATISSKQRSTASAERPSMVSLVR